jgi:hypothetical protein
MNPVDSVINPQLKGPGHGLPDPFNGQRYLIVDSIGAVDSPFSDAWGDLVANANDIIQYSSAQGKWVVAFDSSVLVDVQYVTNLTTKIQYRYSDGIWVKSWEGWYDDGDWSIVI